MNTGEVFLCGFYRVYPSKDERYSGRCNALLLLYFLYIYISLLTDG